MNFIRRRIPDNLDKMFDQLANGECRLLSASGESDESGFGAGDYAARREDFVPCQWRERPVRERDVALAARASSVIEISLPFVSGGAEVKISDGDRLELRAHFSPVEATVRTLEIASIVSQSGVRQNITAIDLEN